MEKPSADRLGPDTWLAAAYAMFEEGGVNAVRIDPLAKRLNITRGSFYWHFKDRAALLRAVLDRWVEQETERTIAANEDEGGEAAKRLLRLLKTCASDDGRLEVGVREWATGDPDALEIVRKMDERRIGYMAELAREAGAPEHEATARARLAYLAWLGFYTGIAPAPVEQRLADMEQLQRMVLAQ